MKKTKFSEWVNTRHPDFQLDESLFGNPVIDRLKRVTDRKSLPRPIRRISNDKNIQGIARNFIERVKDAVRSIEADNIAISKAAERAAGAALSPRAANELFLAAAMRNETMAMPTITKILLSMTDVGARMSLRDPTLAASRSVSRMAVEKEIDEKGRVRIEELLSRFLNSLVGPSSGPTATPAE